MEKIMFEGITGLLERRPQTPTTPEKTEVEPPKSETEIRAENNERSIRSKRARLTSLNAQLEEIDIPYFADKHHPKVQGDMILKNGLQNEIKRLEKEIAELESEGTNPSQEKPNTELN